MIRFHCGRWRWVIALPPLGIVLKFPRFYPRECLRGLWSVAKVLRRLPLRVIWNAEFHSESAIIRYSIGGLLDNLGEWRFYRQTQHPFLQPTYFSLFGLMNVQRYGTELSEDSEREYERMSRWGLMTDWEVYKDGHTFASNKNFVVDQFGLTHIVDYGQPRTQRILLRWADSLCIGFRTTLSSRPPE